MFYLSHGGWHIFILLVRLTWQMVKIFSLLPENVTISSTVILHSPINWFGIAKWCGYIPHKRQPVKYSPSALVFPFCFLLTWEKINIHDMCVCVWMAVILNLWVPKAHRCQELACLSFPFSCKKGRQLNNNPFIDIHLDQ